jgi:3-hydroxyacyl-CoA dehydrogenase
MGLTAAIDFILGGELIPAGQLSKFPLFDQIVDSGQVMQAALAFARGPRVAQDLERGTLPLIRHMAIPDPNPAAVMRAAFDRLTPGDFMGREGLRAILAGVEAESFDEGLASARAIFERLVTSDHARQQRDSFFKSRGASVKER